MGKTTGRVTLPGESNFLEESKDLLKRWGADAIRAVSYTHLVASIGLTHVSSKQCVALYTTVAALSVLESQQLISAMVISSNSMMS